MQISKLALSFIAFPVFAAPTVTAVMNAAGNASPALPNSAIAQGSIFIVKGSGLGPANLSIAPTPFQNASLSGTSVVITVGGATINGLMYYTSDTQIAALLPSNAPAGAATLTVTYNGQTSPAARFSTISNNFGIFPVDSTGQGPAIVTYADYSLVSSYKAANCGGPNTTCGAANPGDTLILWGTGLGAVLGSDAAGAGLGQNMPNLPLKLWIGGVQAKVAYQGRSGCCVGEDQIVFTVPDIAPTGCGVPLAVQLGTNTPQVSNQTVIPIAKASRECVNSSVPELSARLFNSSVNIGFFELDHFLNDNGAGFHDVLQGGFLRAAAPPAASAPFVDSASDHPPLGTCSGIANPVNNNGLNIVGLIDGGSTFTVKGPNGSATVTVNAGDKVTLSATGAFLVPGNYTVTGSGGKDVGPFTATLNIPVSPTLTNPTSANGLTVTRSAGMTITWNPNGTTGHVELVLTSYADANNFSRVTCEVAGGAGTFTIPDYALSVLPPGTGTNFYFQLGDEGAATSTTFAAAGIDIGIAQTFIDAVRFGGFTVR